jgi:hypothetical protein
MAGALAGAAHVALAPDHVMALLVLSAEARARAWRVGLSWGLGHALAIAFVALVLLRLRDLLKLDFLGEHGEDIAGWMLIGLGAWGLYHVWIGAAADDHAHAAGPDHGLPRGHLHTWIAFVAGFAGGLVHSVAGNGLLLAVIPAMGLDVGSARLFLVAFVCATVICVIGLAGALGLATSAGVRADPSRFQIAVASASLALGIAWVALAWAGVELHVYPG